MASKHILGIFLCVIVAAMAAPNKRLRPLKAERSNEETSMEVTKECTGKVSGQTEDDDKVIIIVPMDRSRQQPGLKAAPQGSSGEKHTKIIAQRKDGKGYQQGSRKVISMGFSKEDLTNEVFGNENERVIIITPTKNKNKGERPKPIVKNKGDKHSRPKYYY